MTTNATSPLSQVLTPATIQTILSTVTDRLADSAIAVRKNALNTYSCCAVNALIRPSMKDQEIVSIITSLLQDASGSRRESFSHLVMVKRSALQLYYKLLETTASLKPLFFSISLSMFENTTNTDVVITKNVQTFVIDPIIHWTVNRSNLSGWELMEYCHSGNVSAFEVRIALLSHAVHPQAADREERVLRQSSREGLRNSHRGLGGSHSR